MYCPGAPQGLKYQKSQVERTVGWVGGWEAGVELCGNSLREWGSSSWSVANKVTMLQSSAAAACVGAAAAAVWKL